MEGVGGSDSSFTVKFHRDETHGMPAFPPASACLLSMCVETGQRERWCVCRGAPTIKRGREDKHSNICSLLHSALRFWRGRAVLVEGGGTFLPTFCASSRGRGDISRAVLALERHFLLIAEHTVKTLLKFARPDLDTTGC